MFALADVARLVGCHPVLVRFLVRADAQIMGSHPGRGVQEAAS